MIRPAAGLGTHAARRRWELVAIAAVAILLRVAVFAGATRVAHVPVATYTAEGDTVSYVRQAAAMAGRTRYADLDEYDRRVFPGYPAMIAVVHAATGLGFDAAALAVTWACTGVAAVAVAAAVGDARVGWAMTCLLPHYGTNSSLGMGEAPTLACVGLALLAARGPDGAWDRWRVAGLLLGVAGLVRPMACFAALGVAVAMDRGHRRRAAMSLLATAAAVVVAGLIVMQLWTGDALQGAHVYATHPGAYGGHLVGWPFQSLLTTPGREGTPAGRVAYVWAHVAVVLLACFVASRRVWVRRRGGDPRDALMAPWLVGNTLFVLCIGSRWGFAHFPRFTIPAEPALFWTCRAAIPRRPLVWVPVVAIAVVLAAVYGIARPVV